MQAHDAQRGNELFNFGLFNRRRLVTGEPRHMSMIDASPGTRLLRHEGADDRISASLHHEEVPAFAEQELERLYSNVYASLKEWRASGALRAGTSTYVERQDGRITTLYLFRCDGREIRVLNEGIVVNADEAGRFAKAVFRHYPQAGAISFHAVRASAAGLSYPCRQYDCLEDIVLALPASSEAYLASMGGATRSYIKRYLNKARRSFPSFTHEVRFGADIDESALHEVIAFNRLRMEGKGKVQEIDAGELRRIVALARECGMLSVVRIDGKIRAGTINFQIGDDYFLEVIAHDPAFNDYRLGTLCCYLTICECIARGGRQYHFLWGAQEYKFRLLGVQQELQHLVVYRSGLHALLCAGVAVRNARQEWLRRGRTWWRAARAGENGVGRFLAWIGGMRQKSLRT